MDKYLETLKPALRAQVDEAVGEGGGPKGVKEDEMASQSFSVEQGKGGIRGAAREAAAKAGGARDRSKSPVRDKEKPPAAAKVAAAAPAPAKAPVLTPEQRSEMTCQFCGNFDVRYTEPILDLHFVRSCPMLTPCPLCVQVIEVSLLQDHLNEECDKRADHYKKCQRCKFAIKIDAYDKHVSDARCVAASSDFVVCPMCQSKVSPPNEAGWAAHLLKAPGCPSNPRRFDGKGGEEFTK